MVNVTQNQLRKKFLFLPPLLQTVIFSPKTEETISRIIVEHHLDDERAEGIAEATGLVLFGIIHIEDVAQEIEERTGIKREIANSIAKSLNARLFSPLQEEIKQAYYILPSETSSAESDFEEEIEKTETEKEEAPEEVAEIKVEKIEKEVSKIDETLSKIQKTAENEPRFFEESPKETSVEPKVAPMVSAPDSASSASEIPIQSSEINIQNAPVFIHEESTAAPVAAIPSFRLKLNSLFSKLGISTKPKVPLPPKPAEIELGTPPPPPQKLAENENAEGAGSSFELPLEVEPTIAENLPSRPPIPFEGVTPKLNLETEVIPPPAVSESKLELSLPQADKNENQPKIVDYNLENLPKEENFSEQKPNFILAPKATEEKSADDIILAPQQELVEVKEESKQSGQVGGSKVNLFKKFFSSFPKITKFKKTAPQPEVNQESLLASSPPSPPLPPPPPSPPSLPLVD